MTPQIKAVFKDLRSSGYLARMNFSCCGSCGSYELFEDMKKKKKRGYAFFHKQDTQAAEKTGELYIRYGAKTGAESFETANHIVRKLKLAGLAPEWNGDTSQCIKVKI